MFTGIVEEVGEVVSLERDGELCHFVLEAGAASRDVKLGDSVAINGTCLTVTAIDGTRLSFDAVAETLEKTSLGGLRPAARVNLERAMRAGAGLDGHIVQGHVDDTGEVERMERNSDDVRLFIRCARDFADLLVEKGSVAIDGVSLTVVDVREAGFDVALIPHTLERTILDGYTPGQRVNLEADVLGKYVKKYLDRILAKNG